MILSGTSTISGFAACGHKYYVVHVSDMQSGSSVNAFRALKMVNLPLCCSAKRGSVLS